MNDNSTISLSDQYNPKILRNPKILLQLKSLTIGTAEQVLIKGMDLNLFSGEIVGIFGPSGCGKTTLLRTNAENQHDPCFYNVPDREKEIEMELSLGASRWESARGAVSDGIRRGMIPIINSMMVVGIVSLPGMMTGQILEGADPVNAVKYQIVVMFMIAAATAMSCVLMSLFIFKRLFNSKHQMRNEMIFHLKKP